MSKLRSFFSFLIVFSVIMFFSCENDTENIEISDSATPVQILPALQNFSLRVSRFSYGFYYTFTFSPVEYAKSYLIYHYAENNKNKAEPFVAGEFSPIKYTFYYSSDSVSGLNYFWVRAYDGENYGEWSEVVARNSE